MKTIIADLYLVPSTKAVNIFQMPEYEGSKEIIDTAFGGIDTTMAVEAAIVPNGSEHSILQHQIDNDNGTYAWPLISTFVPVNMIGSLKEGEKIELSIPFRIFNSIDDSEITSPGNYTYIDFELTARQLGSKYSRMGSFQNAVKLLLA